MEQEIRRPNNDYGYSVAVDGYGNVVATGWFQGSADFGGGSLASAGGYDVFLVKYEQAECTSGAGASET